MKDYDLIVIGAGHNALVCAAYVAQAGFKVGVFERRAIVGGAVSTEHIVPEYAFDYGGSAHILIRLTPIVEELGLDAFGLEYIELDPMFYVPSETDSGFYLYRDLDRTVDHLDSIFPGQGAAYGAFVKEWAPIASSIRDAFLATPSPFELGKKFVHADRRPDDWEHAVAMILKPYGEVADVYFEEERLKACLTWMAAQSGPPPTEPLTGPFLLWHPLYHEGGIARPRGGSGMLTAALQAHIEHHGGTVHLGSEVEEIILDAKRAIGVRTREHSYTSDYVVSGTHVAETLGRLLPRGALSSTASQLRLGNGFGAVLRLALDSPAEYPGAHPQDSKRALQLLCRDRAQIRVAYSDYLNGKPSSDPPIVAMSFSAVDDTLAPANGEVLWLWAQYYPYELDGSATWDQIAEREADKIIDAFERYSPGLRGKIVGQLFQHPLWLERELGLRRGNVMHLEMSLDQMFFLRPSPSLSGYRTPIERLYLTGASTHPGGGIMGASGRNAARVLLSDMA